MNTIPFPHENCNFKGKEMIDSACPIHHVFKSTSQAIPFAFSAFVKIEALKFCGPNALFPEGTH